MMGKILVFGSKGQVGREIVSRAGAAAIGLDHAALDICNAAGVRQAVREHAPSAIVNAAGYTAVDRAETEPDVALRVNLDGAAIVAEAASSARVPLIHVSTDYVFDGSKRTPYREDDPLAPLNAYGRSKAEGERMVRSSCPHHVILRTSWIYSPHGNNFVCTMLRLGAERPELKIVDDQIGCPTSAADLASAALDILAKTFEPGFAAWGTYHYRGGSIITWHGFAKLIFGAAARYGHPVPRVVPIVTQDHPSPARRPAYSVLSMEKLERTFGIKPRSLCESLRECLDVYYARGQLDDEA